ncbi:DUF1295 domain-containing protein [Nakamurella lactea]|uniref:DUF1295 domain-containing protein n=1 Tax=Nakamurella lactea TaxID=459515 RepID=UPI0003FAFCD1|nr:DUF1295 domain-containing protein [Nakamurella lactea]
MTTVLFCLAGTAAAVVVLMAATFLAGRSTGRYSVIDVVWGPGFAVVAWVAMLLASGHGTTWLRWTVAAMVTVWGLRLGVHIGRRNRGRAEDPRYVRMLSDAGAMGVVRRVHLPQGVVMWVVSLPVQAAMLLTDPVVVVVAIGVAVWAIGLIFESVGDRQLAAFQAQRTDPDRILRSGLWRYTRHPNYFGDACAWWGLFLTVAWAWPGLLTVVSPLLMTYLLVAKTGKALTEQRMHESRPGYAEYVRSTSGFVPLPPKRLA